MSKQSPLLNTERTCRERERERHSATQRPKICARKDQRRSKNNVAKSKRHRCGEKKNTFTHVPRDNKERQKKKKKRTHDALWKKKKENKQYKSREISYAKRPKGKKIISLEDHSGWGRTSLAVSWTSRAPRPPRRAFDAQSPAARNPAPPAKAVPGT